MRFLDKIFAERYTVPVANIVDTPRVRGNTGKYDRTNSARRVPRSNRSAILLSPNCIADFLRSPCKNFDDHKSCPYLALCRTNISIKVDNVVARILQLRQHVKKKQHETLQELERGLRLCFNLRTKQFEYNVFGVHVCAGTWEEIYGFSHASANRQRACLRKGFGQKNTNNSTARVIRATKTALVLDALRRHFEIVGQTNPATGILQVPLECKKDLRSAFQFKNTVSQTHFNKLYIDVVKALKVQVRRRPDTTGQCDVCSELNSILRNPQARLSERNSAVQGKKNHWSDVSFEINTVLEFISQAIQYPENYTAIEMDAAAQHKHLLPNMGTMRRPKCLNKSNMFKQKLTGVLFHGSLMFAGITDDAVVGGADLNISVLLRALQVHGKGLTKKNLIVVDGGSDNWCKTFLGFMVILMTKYPRAEEIIVARLPVGHTHSLTIDGCFGDLAKTLQGSVNTAQGKTNMGAYTPQEFICKLEKCWNKSKRVVKSRVAVERLSNSLGFTAFLQDKIDSDFGKFGTPRDGTIDKNIRIAEALGKINLTANRPPHVIRFKRQRAADDDIEAVVMEYKIHFKSSTWLPRDGKGINLIPNLASITGKSAPQRANMKTKLKSMLSAIDVTSEMVNKLNSMYSSSQVVPPGALQDWKLFRTQVRVIYF